MSRTIYGEDLGDISDLPDALIRELMLEGRPRRRRKPDRVLVNKNTGLASLIMTKGKFLRLRAALASIAKEERES